MTLIKQVLSIPGRRLLALSLTVAIMMLAETATAQSQQIELPVERITLKELFKVIKTQTKMVVAYNGREFDANRQMSFSSKTITLDQAMSEALQGSGFTFTQKDGAIIISAAPVPEQSDVAPVMMTLGEKTGDKYRKSSPEVYSTTPLRREPGQEITTTAATQSEELAVELNYTSESKLAQRFAATQGALPVVALKTNLLYWAGALTPNLGVEVGIGRRSTLDFSGSYNPWKRTGTFDSNKKLTHMILRADYRYWFCERFNGHNIGGGAIYGRYNIAEYKIPGIFEKQYRYNGYAYGVEVNYGYHFMLGKRWGLELGLGVGVMQFEYDRFPCAVCNRNEVRGSKTYFGPTNASVNLVFLIK